MNKKSIFKDGANKNLTHPKQNKGITLVALVITIIVLIILAGVSINAVMNGGLITNAKDAKNEYEKGKAEENKVLSQLEISKVEMDFLSKGVPYNLKHKYLTGVKLNQKAVELKKELNQYGYELYTSDKNVIEETDETTKVYTGMLIKEKGKEDVVGEVVLFGDVNGVDQIDLSDGNLIIKFVAGIEEPSQIQKVASDVNHDGYLSYADYDILSKYCSKFISEIEQNKNAMLSEIIYNDDVVEEKFKNTGLQLQFKKHSANVVGTGINIGTTINDLYNTISNKVDVEFRIDGTGVVKTGTLISGNSFGDSLVLVIFGDITMDGLVDSADLDLLYQYITDEMYVKYECYDNIAQVWACDINGDGDLTKDDYDLLKSCIENNKTTDINQNRKATFFIKDWSTWERTEAWL